jgi:hypothetical protein
MANDRLLALILACLGLAACAGSQPSIAPNLTPASHTAGSADHPQGHLIVIGARPPKGCPSGYVYCVTLRRHSHAQLYFCYSTGSYCGPSQYQYTWSSEFFVVKTGRPAPFVGDFYPNPSDPTTDIFNEYEPLHSTHGKYKYAQFVCPKIGSSCQANFYVAIAIR